MFVLGENHFRKCGCLVGPKNRIFRKLISVDRKKKALTMEIILHFHFHFKVFPERERESERARGRRPSSSPVQRSPTNLELQSAPISRAPVRRLRSEIAIYGVVVMGLSSAARSRASSVNLGFVRGGDGFVFSL